MFAWLANDKCVVLTSCNKSSNDKLHLASTDLFQLDEIEKFVLRRYIDRVVAIVGDFQNHQKNLL